MFQRSGASLRVHPLDAPFVVLSVREGNDERGIGVPVDVAALRIHGGVVAARFAWPGDADGQGALTGLVTFAGDAAVVGHDLAAPLAALAGLGAAPAGPPWDLAELAELLVPDGRDGSLVAIAHAVGAAAPSRLASAMGEAELTRAVYAALLARARTLPAGVLRRLAMFLRQAQSPLADLLAALADVSGAGGPIAGVDRKELAERLGHTRAIGSPAAPVPVDPAEVERVLSPQGAFARLFPRYEARPEQVAMARAVAGALGGPTPDGKPGAPHHLVVEGGTGIGKSVAYLLPVVLFAARNNARVVVSTNTINLQEQLVGKDLPDVLAALAAVPDVDVSRVRFSLLKGKANYLCLRRWEGVAAQDALTADEARTLAKSLVWLRTTKTGDRGELRLTGREQAVWERLSASGFSMCPGAREGSCFYRHARDEASGAHVMVVNHALLLSDLVVKGGLLPPYDYLIVDEAHHLEAETTRQFGFRVTAGTVEELNDRLTALLHGASAASHASALDPGRRESLQARLDEAQVAVRDARTAWAALLGGLAAFAKEARAQADDEGEMRVLPAHRAQPAWSELEVTWDSFHGALGEAVTKAEAAARNLESLPAGALPGADAITGGLAEWTSGAEGVREQVQGFISRPVQAMVYWLGQGGPVSLNGAPLEVASLLRAGLFATKRSVVLTSATMAVRGSFAHVRERLGVEEPEELVLGSPFDYKRAALLCMPPDVPQPGDRGYTEAVAGALRGFGEVADGHVMALFTSHAAVRAVSAALCGPLATRGIGVLAQGVDGTPQQLIARFQRAPRAVLVGTASFWEGVDIGNAALKVLVVGRLPFNVPTEPVFAARAALYEEPFMQYAVPQAVLRFRQGFGRLIRGKGDRGVVVILDSRISAKSYGRWFTAALPGPAVYAGPLASVPERIRAWLAAPNQGAAEPGA